MGADISRREFYPSLEILRGLCAAEVFLWHIFAHIYTPIITGTFWEPISYTLWRLSEVAVLTFMVISGFVVSNSFMFYRRQYGDQRAVPIFLSARAIRIWSLSIPIALVSFALRIGYGHIADDWRDFKRFDDISLLPWSALALDREWIGTGWTLPFEMFGYAMLPFVLIIGIGTWGTRAISVLSLAIVLAFFLLVVEIHVPTAVPMLSCFALGVVFYFLRGLRPPQWIGLPLAIASIVTLVLIGQIQTSPLDNMHLKLPACGAMFIAFFAMRPKPTFLTGAFVVVGAASYSLYLWHWPIIYFGNLFYGYVIDGEGSASAYTRGGITFLLVVLVPVTFGATYLSYRLIEKKARMSWVIDLFAKRRNIPAE